MTDAGSSADLFINQVFVNAACSYLIEFAKNNKAPFLSWISHCSPVINRIVSAVIAALTAAGFTATYDQHGGTLVLTGVTLQGALLFLYLFARAYFIQHTTYKLIQTAATAKMISRASSMAKLPEPPVPLI